MKVTGLKASEQDRLDILEKIANSEIMVAGYTFSNSLKKVPAFHEMEDPELEEKASNAVRIIDARADIRRKFQNEYDSKKRLPSDTSLEIFKNECLTLCNKNSSDKIAEWMKAEGVKAPQEDRLFILERIAGAASQTQNNFLKALKKVPDFAKVENLNQASLISKTLSMYRIQRGVDSRHKKRKYSSFVEMTGGEAQPSISKR